MRAKIILAAVGVALLGFGVAAFAQSYSPPGVSIVNPTDCITIVQNALGTAQSKCATPAQITSQMGYGKFSPATGFSYTFGNSQTLMVLTNSTTLASGTIVLAAAPSDGDENCLYAQNTVTSLTVSAPNTTLHNAVTTIAAAAQVCYLYSLSTNTWDRAH